MMAGLPGKKNLELIFFDVGLGDCVLAVSDGKVLLIDGGSWCCDSLKLYLKEKSIRHIHSVICTHAHEDHVDGLAEIAEIVTFGNVYSNITEFSPSQSFTKLRECLEKDGKKIIVPQIGDSITVGNCKVIFLGPGNMASWRTGNDRSLTCMLECCHKKFLMTADIGDRVIREWLESGVDVRADVLKVPHHGLEDLREEFLEAVKPEMAVISYGKNSYGPLSRQLLKKLDKRNIAVLRTDRTGDIVCSVYNDHLEISPVDYKKKLEGKKLLILAANEETKKFVTQAQSLGIYTIVTDHVTDSPAKRTADKSYDINGKDTDKIIRMAVEEKIDGIIVGVADPLAAAYLEISKQLGFPCYLSEENISFFTNKKVFQKICRQNGIHTIKEYYSGACWADVGEKEVEYPCIVKPVCGRGGKGVALCNNTEELKKAFLQAQTYSDNGEVMIEAYMNYRDIIANYFFVNGSVYLLGVSDREVLKGKNIISPVTYGNIYPSDLTDAYVKQCHPQFVRLFRKLHIYNGILEMQIFWDGENFYPYDPACILGGELSGPIFTKVFNIDLIDCFLTYSLTGNMNCSAVPSDNGVIPNGGCAQSIWILLRTGTIGRIEGTDKLESVYGVLGYLQRLHEGDTVSEDIFETEKSVLARIWVRAETFAELENLVSVIRKQIRVFDIYGQDMIWEGNEREN